MNKETTKTVVLVDPKLIKLRENFNPRYKPSFDDILPLIRKDGVRDAVEAVKQLDGSYLLNAQGHRRFHAVEALLEEGVKKSDNGQPLLFPIIEVEEPADINDIRYDIITLNTGKPLTVLEKAKVYEQIVGELSFKDQKDEWVKKVKEISANVGESYQSVSNALWLMDAPKSLHKVIEAGKVSASFCIELFLKDDKAKGNWDKVEELVTDSIAKAIAKGKKKADKTDTKDAKDEKTETKADKAAREKAEKEAAEQKEKDVAERKYRNGVLSRVFRFCDFGIPLNRKDAKGVELHLIDLLQLTGVYLHPDSKGDMKIEGDATYGDINANYKAIIRAHNLGIKEAVKTAVDEADKKSEEKMAKIKEELEEYKSRAKAAIDAAKGK